MDFDVQPSKITVTEFSAVVLAGYGHDLSPLTNDNGNEPCPKALLPVGNRPMIDYPLAWLDRSDIRDVLLICPPAHLPAISHHINSDSTSSSFSSLRIDLQALDETVEIGLGTSAILNHFANRIKHDFILLSCDFIPPLSLPLGRILNKFRADVSAEGAIAAACWFEPAPDKGSFEESGGGPGAPPIVWDDEAGTLLYVSSHDEMDSNQEEVELRMSLLSRAPRARMSNKFHDSHVYVCRRTVLDALERKSRLESFREDFFPWLCKLQYQMTRRDKYGRVLVPMVDLSSQAAALQHSTLHISTGGGAQSVTYNQDSPDEEETETSVAFSTLRVGLVLHRGDEGVAARVNDLNAYLDANRRVVSSPDYTYTAPSDPDRRSLVDSKAQVSADSMIGESTKVEERTTIKKSIIGKHCIIGKMAKIVGCVILDHCVIGDGAKLESCLIGKNTKIGAKADLSRCATQAGYEVEAAETVKNEKLEVSHWAAADSEEEGSDVSGSEESSEDED